MPISNCRNDCAVSSPPAIIVSSLSKQFGEVRAVDRLSFEVHAGEIFGLVGPDGAGKTTTLRMLAGVLAADSGSAMVAGNDVVRDPEGAKYHLSYMSQRFGLYEDLTVEENIRFYADLFGVRRKQREQRSQELLVAAGLSDFRKRLAGNLSGGMKQKLGLVCSLIHTPQVLLLDEPTNGVDPVSRRDSGASCIPSLPKAWRSSSPRRTSTKRSAVIASDCSIGAICSSATGRKN